MKRLFAALLLSALTLAAADPSGNWTGSMKPADGSEEHPIYMILKADGAKLSGSGGPGAGEQHPFDGGSLEGDRLVFTVVAGKGTFHFDLKLKDGKIEGAVELRGGPETRTGKVVLEPAK